MDLTPAPGSRRFETTRWTLVLAAGGADTAQARPALDDLCRIYWPPLYAFVRRRGHNADEAKDLTQTIGRIERTRFAGIPLAALDTTVARPL